MSDLPVCPNERTAPIVTDRSAKGLLKAIISFEFLSAFGASGVSHKEARIPKTTSGTITGSLGPLSNQRGEAGEKDVLPLHDGRRVFRYRMPATRVRAGRIRRLWHPRLESVR
jgi:hypothetical protein